MTVLEKLKIVFKDVPMCDIIDIRTTEYNELSVVTVVYAYSLPRSIAEGNTTYSNGEYMHYVDHEVAIGPKVQLLYRDLERKLAMIAKVLIKRYPKGTTKEDVTTGFVKSLEFEGVVTSNEDVDLFEDTELFLTTMQQYDKNIKLTDLPKTKSELNLEFLKNYAETHKGFTINELEINQVPASEYEPEAHNDTKFVTIATNSNVCAMSSDGMNWAEYEISDTKRYWRGITYANGIFVAPAYNSTVCAVSSDGMNWTEYNISDTSRRWQSITYANGIFVAVAYNSNICAVSSDGMNWTEYTISDTSRGWINVTYGNGVFVIVATNSTVYAVSSDGINWTEYTISSINRYWYVINYANGIFVAVAYNSNICTVSSDGMNWTEYKISDTSRNWWSITYGNGIFVTAAYNSTVCAVSSDGMNWTEYKISNTSRNWHSITYANGIFVTVATDSNICAMSSDGMNWTEYTISDTSRNWWSIASHVYGAKIQPINGSAAPTHYYELLLNGTSSPIGSNGLHLMDDNGLEEKFVYTHEDITQAHLGVFRYIVLQCSY